MRSWALHEEVNFRTHNKNRQTFLIEKGSKKMLELLTEIIAEKLPNVERDMDIQLQETQRNSLGTGDFIMSSTNY